MNLSSETSQISVWGTLNLVIKEESASIWHWHLHFLKGSLFWLGCKISFHVAWSCAKEQTLSKGRLGVQCEIALIREIKKHFEAARSCSSPLPSISKGLTSKILQSLPQCACAWPLGIGGEKLLFLCWGLSQWGLLRNADEPPSGFYGLFFHAQCFYLEPGNRLGYLRNRKGTLHLFWVQ